MNAADKEKAPIYAELPEDFIRRMRNWARSCDGGPVSTSRLEDRVDYTRDERPIPLLMGESDDTHKAVLLLPQRYQEVITVFWRYEARDLRWMSRATPRLRLWKLGPASFMEWLSIGHERLRVLVAKGTSEQGKRRASYAEGV